ncbi:uncharacterized protein BP01DRAFT_354189 [Aspergillus saccharolyticus JOP 1030-1]|uniref:DUF7707 domain-containing protein n=1 Tax=Aspergillus saccharolyticus JOP 1030-1 TaxID=1450539 RepID=A0A319AM71_9EURO|nr:hypothetical protein BP01DRAFT_354189 [Aspergillus saccharolyticus JOP 1030-1]PYH47672.1 hypothetical protein BP01DRAFT_354189 [Aspergillus saccharolyticus JOP 1030-1]
MHLLRSVIAVTSWALLVSGQNSSYTVNVNDIPIKTRDQWCEAQTSQCPLICLQLPGTTSQPKQNTCDPQTLYYNCVCSNGLSPNASQYSQTIPYFLCTEENNECVSKCNGNSLCQSDCRSQHPCGAQDPKRVNATSTSNSTPAATAASTTTSLAPFTGVPDEGVAPRSLADMAQLYGLVTVVGAFLAGFTTLI